MIVLNDVVPHPNTVLQKLLHILERTCSHSPKPPSSKVRSSLLSDHPFTYNVFQCLHSVSTGKSMCSYKDQPVIAHIETKRWRLTTRTGKERCRVAFFSWFYQNHLFFPCCGVEFVSTAGIFSRLHALYLKRIVLILCPQFPVGYSFTFTSISVSMYHKEVVNNNNIVISRKTDALISSSHFLVIQRVYLAYSYATNFIWILFVSEKLEWGWREIYDGKAQEEKSAQSYGTWVTPWVWFLQERSCSWGLFFFAITVLSFVLRILQNDW